MSSTLHVYVGPCLKAWMKPEQVQSEFMKLVDAYVEKSNEGFSKVFSGDHEEQVFLIPNQSDNSPNRYCEWQKNDHMQSVTISSSDVDKEMEMLFRFLTANGWPEFAYELTWGVVPYYY